MEVFLPRFLAHDIDNHAVGVDVHHWFRLCFKLYSDVGGSDEAMKQLNVEYEILFERVKRIHVNKSGETYERDTEKRRKYFVS